MKELISNYQFTLDTIADAAGKLLLLDPEQRIFLFEAEMGAGKTTLIKELCKKLKSNDNFSSPTFSIVNEYIYPGGKIFHFDLYRVKNTAELLDIGFDDYINSGNYCFIEWPELSKDILDEGSVVVKILQAENKRYLHVTKL